MRWFGWFRKQRGQPGIRIPTDGSPTMMVEGRERTVGLPYMLPADTEEINRLDFQHFMLRFAFQGNYAAPIHEPQSVLDVGTGTGRWAREMAQMFPRANVIGLDVKPPAVDDAAESGRGVDLRPPNYSFVAGNVFEGLPFPDHSFDFVHMRLLFSAIPADRWSSVVAELARVTRPGGWVESVETAGVQIGSPTLDLLAGWLQAVVARRGVDLSYGARVGELMGAAGLTEVSTREVLVPFGVHGGRVGSMCAMDYLSVARSLGGFVVSAGVASQEQFDQILAEAQREADDPAMRSTAPFYIAIGRRV
ncbi:MAG TPA: methyltransferase domain-containing protein [Ktedonobacterales bacterium]